MQPYTEAYLDIETTGLSFWYCEITVIGIYLCNGTEVRSIQLVGDEISDVSLMEALEGVDIIYTYNGSRFDIPFISRRLGVDLSQIFTHRDLMYDCWRNNLKGGFKAVEKQPQTNTDKPGQIPQTNTKKHDPEKIEKLRG